MFPTPIERTSPTTQRLYKVSLPIALVVWLLPLIAVMMTSVRSLQDITQGNYWGWPSEFHLLENYAQVFTATPMTRYLINSLIITVPTVAGTLAISALAGAALALYRFRSNMLLFAMFIAGNFIPFQILMIPVRDLMVELGMYDTYMSLILFHMAFQAGFCTLFMRNFIKGLPFELIESARVEGVSEFRIFWNIVLPLMRPAIAALSVLVFTFIWNDYFWATVLTTSAETQPVTAGLYSLNGQWIAQWQLVSAGSIIAAMPPVLMFFLMQKHFIAGLTLGATKG
jgi:multiple sugar transport system permease protein